MDKKNVIPRDMWYDILKTSVHEYFTQNPIFQRYNEVRPRKRVKSRNHIHVSCRESEMRWIGVCVGAGPQRGSFYETESLNCSHSDKQMSNLITDIAQLLRHRSFRGLEITKSQTKEIKLSHIFDIHSLKKVLRRVHHSDVITVFNYTKDFCKTENFLVC